MERGGEMVEHKAAEGARTYPHPQVSDAVKGQCLMRSLITDKSLITVSVDCSP